MTCRWKRQTRLLRVLQQGEYTTVGGRTPIRTNVRIVAATNKDLRISIQQGLFREDLYFRLNVVPLRLPPLRERVEDIPDLMRHFFAQIEKEGLARKQIDAEAMDRLKALSLARECARAGKPGAQAGRIVPRRITITAPIIDGELDVKPIETGMSATSDAPGEPETLAGSVERHLNSYFRQFRDGLPPPGLYHRILRDVEGPLIGAALAATRGNQIRAAELLGLNRNTLRKKVRDLDLPVIRTSR